MVLVDERHAVALADAVVDSRHGDFTLAEFAALGAEVLGTGVESIDLLVGGIGDQRDLAGVVPRWSASPRRTSPHEGFIANKGLTVPLLADVDGGVAKSYSAHGRMGTKRAVIVVDEGGIVRHRHDHLLGLDYQSVDDLKAALDALPAATAS
jgi:AhpC/TSA family